jgi:hypothetical protein
VIPVSELFDTDDGTELTDGQTFRHRPSGETVTVVAVDHEWNPYNGLHETWAVCRFPDGREQSFEWPDEMGSILVPTVKRVDG